jgi:hypothetical protein
MIEGSNYFDTDQSTVEQVVAGGGLLIEKTNSIDTIAKKMVKGRKIFVPLTSINYIEELPDVSG